MRVRPEIRSCLLDSSSGFAVRSDVFALRSTSLAEDERCGMIFTSLGALRYGDRKWNSKISLETWFIVPMHVIYQCTSVSLIRYPLVEMCKMWFFTPAVAAGDYPKLKHESGCKNCKSGHFCTTLSLAKKSRSSWLPRDTYQRGSAGVHAESVHSELGIPRLGILRDVTADVHQRFYKSIAALVDVYFSLRRTKILSDSGQR